MGFGGIRGQEYSMNTRIAEECSPWNVEAAMYWSICMSTIV